MIETHVNIEMRSTERGCASPIFLSNWAIQLRWLCTLLKRQSEESDFWACPFLEDDLVLSRMIWLPSPSFQMLCDCTDKYIATVLTWKMPTLFRAYLTCCSVLVLSCLRMLISPFPAPLPAPLSSLYIRWWHPWRWTYIACLLSYSFLSSSTIIH